MYFLLRSVPPRLHLILKSGSLLDNGSHPPPLVLAQRTTFLNEDNVTDVTFIGGIMGHILHPTADKFTVEFMSHFPLNEDNNTFVHGVADDGTLARLSGLARVTHTFQSSR